MAAPVSPQVYPVYILQRVAAEIFHACEKAAPYETLGRILGYRYEWEGLSYVKIVDWVTGSLDHSHVHAKFTSPGIQECESFVDERYGNTELRPVEVGLYHSHPFHTDPHFSTIDEQTFLTFPYDREGNVFLLIDPLAHFFKAFVIASHPSEPKYLKQVPWICYMPQAKDL